MVPSSGSPTGIVDVALTPLGGLAGRYIDGEGRGIDGATVIAAQRETVVGKTATDESGAYSLGGIRPGVYQLTIGNRSQTVRVWHPESAPPAARRLLTMVRDEEVVRGQFGLIGGTVGSTVGVVGGIAGTAAGGYSVTQSMDATDDAETAMKELAELRQMMNALMSP